MKRTLLIVLTLFIPITVIGTLLGGIYYGWPILRNRPYRSLITDFQHAQLKDHRWRGNENDGWDFPVQLADVQTKIQIQAHPYMAVVRVKYEDEDNERPLYNYVDYSHPKEIRTAGQVLYVYWTESLFHTDHWLLAYDLAGRREVIRRRVDPDDLAQIQ